MGDDAVKDLANAGKVESYNDKSVKPLWKKLLNVPNAIFLVSIILILIYFFTLPSSTTNNTKINANTVVESAINNTKLIEINYFYESVNCSSCSEGKSYLEGLKKSNKLVKLNLYEMSHDSENKELLKQYSKDYSVKGPIVVPMIFIRDQYFSGFTNSIGSDINVYINELLS